ncbi:MAG: hypothetical protein PHF86_09000 [Candidatus Nanoarchaeia archaeon]|nr:hypothetical protein [Candidatus Nanoarchaeia archaeon]
MIGTLTTLILTIIAIFLILKFVKKLIFTVISMVFLFLILTTLVVSLTYLDFKDLDKNLNQNTSVIILADNSNYLTGGYINPGTMTSSNKAITNIQNYQNKSYKDILGNNYKLIIIDINYLEKNLPETLDYNKKSITKRDLINILRSENPKNELSILYNIPENELGYTNEELRYQLFLNSLNSLIQKGGINIILLGFKSKEVIVYKETMVFKVIKILPFNYLNKYIVN